MFQDFHSEKIGPIVLYFTFDKNDDRRNNIVAMLNTFLTQVLSHSPGRSSGIGNQYNLMCLHHCWTRADLWLIFKDILCGGAEEDKPPVVICVIDGLDQCDSSWIAFLEDLKTFAEGTEAHFKIAVTSTTESPIRDAVSDWPQLNLDDCEENLNQDSSSFKTEIDAEITRLRRSCPIFWDFRMNIEEKLTVCGRDERWRQLILKQLKAANPSTRLEASQALKILPPTSIKEIWIQILNNVAENKRPWARKALCWILFTFHPLKLEDLATALAIDPKATSRGSIYHHDLVSRDIMSQFENVFGGILVERNNEVHFDHPAARELLLAGNNDEGNAWYDVKETAHQEIADACHSYLSLEEVHELMTASYNPPTSTKWTFPLLTPRDRFHIYAVKYWPRHYSLIPKVARPTKRAIGFISNDNVFRQWTEAYWWHSNPVVRTDKAFLSSLPALAALGIEDLVDWRVQMDSSSFFSQDLALALTEAARNSHATVVHKLLRVGEYSQEQLQDALIAAASSCNEKVLDELISCAETVESFKWPHVVLYGAARCGLEKVIKRLLEHGAIIVESELNEADPDSLLEVASCPFRVAARYGHAGVLKLLLYHVASVDDDSRLDLNKRVSLSLRQASFFGHTDVANLVLEFEAGKNVSLEDRHKALGWATFDGNFKLVEMLAKSGCDLNSGYPWSENWTFLAVAADMGRINSARILLENGANPNFQDSKIIPLPLCVDAGQVKFCQLLLDNGADPNAVRNGRTVLSIAASGGHLAVVKLFVHYGADVDAIDSDGWTPLLLAADKGHIDIVNSLLEKGADINHKSKFGSTALTLAAAGDAEVHAEVTELLVSCGADIHSKTKVGRSAIHYAFRSERITRMLLENKADVNAPSDDGTPLMLAAREKNTDVLKTILTFKPDLEIRNNGSAYWTGPTGFTALSIASSCGLPAAANMLLEAGADINHRTESDGTTPLHIAVRKNSEEVVRILLQYQPDLEVRNKYGNTPLNSINRTTSLKIVKMLVNRGSDLEARDDEGYTPICKAVLFNNVDIVKYFIAKKANLNFTSAKQGPKQRSPLHLASQVFNLELMKLLVASGADTNLPDPQYGRFTPLQTVFINWRYDHVEKSIQERADAATYLINEVGVEIKELDGDNLPLNTACGWSSAQIIELLLEKGAKIDIPDSMGRLPIHHASAHSLESFSLIQSAGADMEAADIMGRTALHWAAIGGRVDVIERVLSLSKDLLNQTDTDGWTPLLWAARGCGIMCRPLTQNTQEQVITTLLDRGANPCVRGEGLERKWSVVQIAKYHCLSDKIIQLLITKAKAMRNAEGSADDEEDLGKDECGALEQTEKPRELFCQDMWCESCVCDIYGIRYKCESCKDFELCYKCYLSRNLWHPNHSFEPVGPEYAEIVEDTSSRSSSESPGSESSANESSVSGNSASGAEAEDLENDAN